MTVWAKRESDMRGMAISSLPVNQTLLAAWLALVSEPVIVGLHCKALAAVRLVFRR